MNKFLFISMAIASAFVIEGCTSPNEENEMETVTYNVLNLRSYSLDFYETTELKAVYIEDPEQYFNERPTNYYEIYETKFRDAVVKIFPDFYDANGKENAKYRRTQVIYSKNYNGDYWMPEPPVVGYIIQYPVDSTYYFSNNSSKTINNEETFVITDNSQIVHIEKKTGVSTTFNVIRTITDTAQITDHIYSCSKADYPNLISKPYVLYDIEGPNDDEFMFLCNDEVNRSNKVFLYHFTKNGNNGYLINYTMVPIPTDKE